MKKEEKDFEITIYDKIINTVGYKYPLCCLALWLVGIIAFAIIISENSK